MSSDASSPENEPAIQLPSILKATDLAESGRGESIHALFSEEQAPRMIKRRVWRSIRQVHDALSEADAEAKRIVEEAEARNVVGDNIVRLAEICERIQYGIDFFVRELTLIVIDHRQDYVELLDARRDKFG